MIEQTARVVDLQGDWVWVIPEQTSGCHSCNAKAGCGTSLLSRLFPNRERSRIRLSGSHLTRLPEVSDRVVIGIAENFLQRSSLLLYLFPLVGLIAGAGLGAWLGEELIGASAAEPISILFGLLGIGGCLMLARHWAAGWASGTDRMVHLIRIEPPHTGVSLVALEGNIGRYQTDKDKQLADK